MGGYKGISNDDLASGKIEPSKWEKFCCLGVLIDMLMPPIVDAVLRAVAPSGFTRSVSFDDVSDDLSTMTNALSSLQPVVVDYVTRAGNRMGVAFSEVKREDQNLHCGMAIRMEGEDVFAGSLTVLDAFLRGKVAFANSVCGALELLFNHLRQQARRRIDRQPLRIIIGVIEITGTVSKHDLIERTLMSNIRRKGRRLAPGFDGQPMFGVFPENGFAHFYGDYLSLRESPLGGRHNG
ncbi:MAG: hypothetical protein ACYDAB_02385 [bacterium]